MANRLAPTIKHFTYLLAALCHKQNVDAYRITIALSGYILVVLDVIAAFYIDNNVGYLVLTLRIGCPAGVVYSTAG